MNNKLIISAVLSLFLISSCATNKPVAKNWGERLREYQIVPIFPPREDVYIGDVYVASVEKQSQPINQKFLPFGLLITTLNLKNEISEFYQNRPSFKIPTTSDGQGNSYKVDNIYLSNDLTKLKRVIFPNFLKSSISDSGLGASIPGETIAAVFGFQAKEMESASISVPDALSYAIPATIVNQKMLLACKDKDFISLASGENSEIYAITEVYYATKMKITINQKASSGVRGEAVVAVPTKKIGKLVKDLKTNATSTKNDSTEQPINEKPNVAVSDQVEKSTDSSAKDATTLADLEEDTKSSNNQMSDELQTMIDNSNSPGFGLWSVRSSGQQIVLDGTFDKAIAIGFRGLKYKIDKGSCSYLNSANESNTVFSGGISSKEK